MRDYFHDSSTSDVFLSLSLPLFLSYSPSTLLSFLPADNICDLDSKIIRIHLRAFPGSCNDYVTFLRPTDIQVWPVLLSTTGTECTAALNGRKCPDLLDFPHFHGSVGFLSILSRHDTLDYNRAIVKAFQRETMARSRISLVRPDNKARFADSKTCPLFREFTAG